MVRSPAGERLWFSGTAGEPVAALMIHDWGKLVLKNDRGHVLWASDRAPKRWDGWNNVTDGRRLRRGQCLRNGSLDSGNGEYAFVVTHRQEYMRRQRQTPPPPPRPRVPAGVPPLPAGDDGSVPVVRTDFSDDAAWQEAVARVSAEYRDGLLPVDPWSIDVKPIDDPRYANLTPEQVAALASNDLWPMLVLADARTMASPERHLLMVCLDEGEDWGRTTRATTAAVVEVATNLWVGNLGWRDYMDPDDADADADSDVFRAWNLKER